MPAHELTCLSFVTPRAEHFASPARALDRILRDLELSPTQLADAQQSYEAVTAVLAKAGMPVAPHLPFMFAQGSMRLGTTVKPIGQDEHDLDVVCLLQKGGIWLPAGDVYELVWDTLGRDGTYEKMRKRKNRCIRLKYARKFYLDIIPAVPHYASTDETLFVCDCEGRSWSISHPVGFADWYGECAKAQPLFTTEFGARAERQITANAGQVEPLPEHDFEKTPLQRITQLFKRDRDQFFQDDPKLRPTSILLTTLAARSYVEQTSVPASDLMEFVIRVAEELNQLIPSPRHRSRPACLSCRQPCERRRELRRKMDTPRLRSFSSLARHARAAASRR